MRSGFSTPVSNAIRIPVDPFRNRQLDPAGVALLWPRNGRRGDGLLAVCEVCDAPGCGARDVQVWAVWVSRNLHAIELGANRQVALEELRARAGFERRRRKRSELYAVIDIDGWIVTPHPLHPPDADARRLLEKLRAELDHELRDYLRQLFQTARNRVAAAAALRIPSDLVH